MQNKFKLKYYKFKKFYLYFKMIDTSLEKNDNLFIYFLDTGFKNMCRKYLKLKKK
jgi:hypothetical protein